MGFVSLVSKQSIWQALKLGAGSITVDKDSNIDLSKLLHYVPEV